MITVYGRASSTNVQKVLWLFDELGLEFERIDRGGEFGGLDDPEFRALNPNGRIPVVVDGGLVMWESHAILRHYARQHPQAGLFPDAPAEAVRADMLLDWSGTTLWPALRPPYWAVAVDKVSREAPEVIAGMAALDAQISILDKLLVGWRYAAGEAFSIADIALAIAVHRWHWTGGDLSRWPALEAWYARCRERPAHAERVYSR